MNKSKQGKVAIGLLWGSVIIFMIVIFNLSSQVAQESNGLSKDVTKVVVKTVKMVSPKTDLNVDRANHLIRKHAHFFVYLILGVLVINAMEMQWRVERGGLRVKRLALALGMCVLYAISDEIHQSFVPGRGPQVKDVIIDSSGAIVGIFIYMVIGRVRKRFMVGR